MEFELRGTGLREVIHFPINRFEDRRLLTLCDITSSMDEESYITTEAILTDFIRLGCEICVESSAKYHEPWITPMMLQLGTVVRMCREHPHDILTTTVGFDRY